VVAVAATDYLVVAVQAMAAQSLVTLEALLLEPDQMDQTAQLADQRLPVAKEVQEELEVVLEALAYPETAVVAVVAVAAAVWLYSGKE
jgi:hypothetical protein